MKKIVIIGSGEDFLEKDLIYHCKEADFVIACDGGLNFLYRLNINPQLYIGDKDSVNTEILNKYDKLEKEFYNSDKDLTDSEISLQKSISYKPDEIIMFGFIGSYIDHSIANLFNLIRNYNESIKFYIYSKNSIIFPIKSKVVITNKINHRFSLFPLGNIKGLKLKGFKYIFKKNNITNLDYSISNIITSNNAEITIKKGYAIGILFFSGFK